MLPFLAAILAGAAVSGGAADAQVSSLRGAFEATCLDGQARLSASDVSAISFDQLPSGLRDSLGRPASGKIWQLNFGGHSYLYMLDYNGVDGSSKVCGLASDSGEMRTAADMLEARMTGTVARNRPKTAQWLNARDGYVATATMASNLNVLQISWMSDAAKAKAQEQLEQLAH